MSDKVFVHLEQRAVLEVGGEDRRAFLQGLVSNDMNKVAGDRAVFTGLLTPQGKFLYDLFVVELGDVFLIEAEAARLEDLRKKLSMYKLRSKVTIAVASNMAVFGLMGEGVAAAFDLEPQAGAATEFAGGSVFVDPRLAEGGLRALLPVDGGPRVLEANDFKPAPFHSWDEARIRLGLPDGSRDLEVDKALLLENGFEELNGVDFNKGCYMGQELTARTKYRGLVKKRLMPVEVNGPMPAPGTVIHLGEAEAGEMRSACGHAGLALIRLDQWRASGGMGFTVGTARLDAAKPKWAVFPESE
ncbi:Folate-dependent protein for Fe/S cluster synthesis/repair in oxidative stress [Paramagnetospirillum magnetotacticum MS-1]|uniref:Folate-dependent protein for Fe/S cluster synthesis/repair in oxidative stress n=1 Tax=Paramagnetospirillum magnetotacticum MS-1 TaxID=272627 RepID=A0A0C2V435_PARME|nr:folate-binding protein YgfZ [Paramagnetospirillum magnetotacticum]KIL99841.1 Folate-dependent protein for Fe/S cluster synthesis/repair in oxidative stress [Paramagnetospirillum magnetotacticum MS-1]